MPAAPLSAAGRFGMRHVPGPAASHEHVAALRAPVHYVSTKLATPHLCKPLRPYTKR